MVRLVISLWLGLFLGSVTHAERQVIKLATIAPKGTVFTRFLFKMRHEIESKSDGQLELRIFAGGKAGDERTIVKKMRAGSIDMAALTGIGLGYIVPRVRILDLPFMFENTRQVDHVVDKLYPVFRDDFRKEGFILAGWNEIGWVYLMSKKPVSRFIDLKGLKVFAPVGDKMVKSMFQEFSVVPSYLRIGDVLPALKKGRVDAIFAPPTGAIGLQWHTTVNYITNLRINNFTAANVIREKAFSRLSPSQQKLLVNTSEKYSKKLVQAVRKSNSWSIRVLRKRGLKMVEINKNDLARFKAKALAVRRKLVSKGMYTAEFLQKVNSIRAAAD